MSKPEKLRKSRRPDGKPRVPKTKSQQQQQVNVSMYTRMDALNKVLVHLAQKTELMAKLTQQMIVTLVILNEKGLVTNDEIAKKQAELMLPIEERISGLGDKISGRAAEAEGGSGETVEGKSETAGDAVSSDPDSDDSPRDTESGEVQPENKGTTECDVRRQGPKLSDNEIEGSDRSSIDREITGEPDVKPSVSAPTDPGHKTPGFSLD